MKKDRLSRTVKRSSYSKSLNTALFDDEEWEAETKGVNIDEDKTEAVEVDAEDVIDDEDILDDEPIIEENALDDEPITEIEPYNEEEANQMGDGKSRNLESGMELLELDFLLAVVETIEGEDEDDVSMRKLTFNELIRTNRVNHVDSLVLKYYTMDEKHLYSKTIQCAAMSELTNRTRQFGADSV